MKKALCIALAASMAVLAAGCNRKKTESKPPIMSQPPVESHITASEPEAMESQHVEEHPVKAMISNLKKDEYEGIKMKVTPPAEETVKPGSIIPLKVEIENTGDKTVVYTLGSGSFKTPNALMVHSEHIQPILPKDHIGPVTMDYVTHELKPGEKLDYVVTIIAAKPHADFDTWSFERFTEGQYMGELTWDEIHGHYPELMAAEEGPYTGHLYFAYYIADAGDVSNPVNEPTSYAEAEFTIHVAK